MEKDCRSCDKRNYCMIKFKEGCPSYVVSKCLSCSGFKQDAKNWIQNGCEKYYPSGCRKFS